MILIHYIIVGSQTVVHTPIHIINWDDTTSSVCQVLTYLTF